ncbi:MAG: hypothetical protein VX642_11665 [Bdellovibrionota bacterium]|nr:hypothetical protein [Bdellovibrionota bacterium]
MNARANSSILTPSFAPIPGESDSPISEKSFSLSGNNDFVGPTDKLVTGSLNLSYGHIWENFAMKLRASWTLVTPVFQYDLNQDLLETPLGKVAEWQRHQLLMAYSIPTNTGGSFKIQWNVSNNLLGENGLDLVQKNIHDVLNSEFYLDSVEPSEEKNYIANELIISYYTSPYFNASLQYFLSLGVSDDYFFGQSHIDAGFLLGSDESFRMYYKYSYAKPRDTGFFKGLLKKDRRQMILAFKVGNYWAPSLSYSSVFLKEDRISQYYLNFYGFYAEF